jgi:hypothetical protein
MIAGRIIARLVSLVKGSALPQTPWMMAALEPREVRDVRVRSGWQSFDGV